MQSLICTGSGHLCDSSFCAQAVDTSLQILSLHFRNWWRGLNCYFLLSEGMDAGSQSLVVAFTKYLLEGFCIVCRPFFGAISFFAQAIGSSFDFSYFAQAVDTFVQSYFLDCLWNHVHFMSHAMVVLISRVRKAAFSPVGRLSRVGREKRGTGRRQLGRDFYPMPFTVGCPTYSATDGELLGYRTVPPQVSYSLV